jgi:hypothetical protein
METPIKILIMIVSWKGNKNLWPGILKNGVDDIVILCGGSDKDSFLENKVINLKCSDSYEGLPEKIICGIDFILNNPAFSSFTHILKIDDHDTYFTKNIMDNIVLKHSDVIRSKHYIGQFVASFAYPRYHYNRVDKDSYWHNRQYLGQREPFVPGHATYILSKHAMQCINNTFNLKNLNFVRRNYILEDVMIGLILSAYDIKPHLLKYGIICNVEWGTINGVKGIWEKIGFENNMLTLKTGTNIRFGKGDKWIEKVTDDENFKGDIKYFGSDPCPGVPKEIHKFIVL